MIDAQSISQTLAAQLDLPLLDLGRDGAAAARLPDGLHLEMRWLSDLSALCLMVTLGTLAEPQRSEAMAGLLMSNLYLADAGQAHYGLNPHDRTLYLCRTVLLDGESPERVREETERMVRMARRLKSNLRAQRLVD